MRIINKNNSFKVLAFLVLALIAWFLKDKYFSEDTKEDAIRNIEKIRRDLLKEPAKELIRLQLEKVGISTTSDLKKDIKKILIKRPRYSPYGKSNTAEEDEQYIRRIQETMVDNEVNTIRGYNLYHMTAKDFANLKTYYEDRYHVIAHNGGIVLNVVQYYEIIGTNRQIIQELEDFYDKDTSSRERILLIINSPGGWKGGISATEYAAGGGGFENMERIGDEYLLRKGHRTIPLDTYVTNKTASAGSFMFLLGENRFMNKDAILMFHNGQLIFDTSEGVVKINAYECESIYETGYLPKEGPQNSPMIRLQERLIKEKKWDKFKDYIKARCVVYDDQYEEYVTFVAEKIKKSKEFVKKHILPENRRDNLLSAEQALKFGIATHILEKTPENNFTEYLFGYFSNKFEDIFAKHQGKIKELCRTSLLGKEYKISQELKEIFLDLKQ